MNLVDNTVITVSVIFSIKEKSKHSGIYGMLPAQL